MFGKYYEPFNPMDYEDEQAARGQTRAATDQKDEDILQGEEDRDMHLGWVNAARGEHECYELRAETYEVCHLLYITAVIHLDMNKHEH